MAKKKCIHEWKDLAVINHPPETSVICNKCGRTLIKAEKPTKNKIKGWAVVNKLSGYVLWGRYGYFITLSREAGKELKNREINKKNLKVIPVIITLNPK